MHYTHASEMKTRTKIPLNSHKFIEKRGEQIEKQMKYNAEMHDIIISRLCDHFNY